MAGSEPQAASISTVNNAATASERLALVTRVIMSGMIMIVIMTRVVMTRVIVVVAVIVC